MIYLIILATMNLMAFCLMGIDKRRAIRKRWRISERALLLSCACFGALGGYLGMRHFHHKTLHKRFAIGVPLMLALQAALIVYLTVRFGKGVWIG